MKQITTMSHISTTCRQMYRFHDRRLVEYGIDSEQLSLLVYIHEHKGVSMYGVARLGHFDKGVVMKEIQRLEEQGCIRVEMDEADKCPRCLYATEKAVAITEQLYGIRQAWNEILVDGLTLGECTQAEQLLRRMMENAWEYMNERN